MPKIKICGLSRHCDIEAVNAQNPDYIGFVFAKSRRQVTPEQAAALRKNLNPNIIPVGVFINEPPENILSLIQKGTIQMVQLHGTEDEEYIKKLKSVTDAPIIKAIPVQNPGGVQKWENTAADYLLLDNKTGGSGQNFNWDLIGKTTKPFFLAGGLNIDNIEKAIAAAAPYAVDISSGVETDGLKDPIKISEIIKKIKSRRTK